MRTRLAALTAVAAVGTLCLTPALAAPTAGKKVVTDYTATATPDPTSTSPVDSSAVCKPTLPSAKSSHPFTAPAAGTVDVVLHNKLDWSLAIRTASGDTLATSDGATPNVQEMTSAPVKKGQTLSIDSCNFSGEPSIGVTLTFTPKK